MGNTNESVLPLQRFRHYEEQKILLINGFCRSLVAQIYHYKQFDFQVITQIVVKHYDYTINTSIRQLCKFIKHCQSLKGANDYYLSVALEISKMLIESHHSIRKQFKGATKKNGLKSKNEQSDEYYSAKLNRYLYINKKLDPMSLDIGKMDFVGKSRSSIGKSQALCPSKTIDNYDLQIKHDPCNIYNGLYHRCLSLADTTINDRGEVPLLKYNEKKYNKLEFDKKRLNVWVHSQDMIRENNIYIPNTKLKYIRCLTRDQYNSTHCYWRLHCLKLNNNGKLLHLKWIGEDKMDDNSNNCIQYLGVVHNWRNVSGGHISSKDLLPQYYEYPCGRHTVWRKVEGVSFVSAHMALCYNEFCATLPQLNNLGQSSNEIHCKLVNSNSKIFWNNKFIKCVEKNLDYSDNKNEAKLIYYYTIIWLNQLIYKVALDHGFNFKIDKQNWNPLARQFQKHIFKCGRIKYYGKDIYFKNDSLNNNNSNNIRIADENYIIQTVDKLLN